MDAKKILLVERECACGCGYKFRVMPTSKTKYMAGWHDPKRKRFDAFLNDYIDLDEYKANRKRGQP